MNHRLLGIGLLLLLGWHTYEKVQTGLLPEMLWTCHIATALAAVGLLGGWPVLAIIAGFFHLGCGLPAWLLEVAVNGTTPSSAALHLVTPAVGLWLARTRGVPRATALGGVGLWLLGLGLGRLVDPALNVNLAWAPYEIWSVPAWVSHLTNIMLVAGALTGLQLVGQRWIR